MDQRKVCNTDYLFKVKRTKGQITIFEFLILQNKTKNKPGIYFRGATVSDGQAGENFWLRNESFKQVDLWILETHL